MIRSLTCCIAFIVITSFTPSAQDIGGGVQADGKRLNNIRTAVPFLMVAPDSRAGGMGDVGAATTPDANSMHWNPAKYAFLDSQAGASLAFTPWLRRIAEDINLAYLAGYYRVDEQQSIAASVKFLSFGEVVFTDAAGNQFQQVNPNEYSIDAAYIRRMSDLLSMALAVRYIRSDIGAGNYEGVNINPGNAVAADIGLYSSRPVNFGQTPAELAFGVHFSNIGSKMQYGMRSYFLPMNLRIGGSTTLQFDQQHSLSFALDLNKLLAPTEPLRDEEGRIIRGKDPDRSVPGALFGSFTDAPGGFSEELREISISTGLEYWYQNMIALRSGFFYSHPTKGDQQFFTTGASLQYTNWQLDFAYLIPTSRLDPLENTLRFTLLYTLGRKNTGG